MRCISSAFLQTDLKAEWNSDWQKNGLLSYSNDEESGEVEIAESGVNKKFFWSGRSEDLRFYAQFTSDY